MFKKIGSVVKIQLSLDSFAILKRSLSNIVARWAVSAHEIFCAITAGFCTTDLSRVLPDYLCIMAYHRNTWSKVTLTHNVARLKIRLFCVPTLTSCVSCKGIGGAQARFSPWPVPVRGVQYRLD